MSLKINTTSPSSKILPFKKDSSSRDDDSKTQNGKPSSFKIHPKISKTFQTPEATVLITNNTKTESNQDKRPESERRESDKRESRHSYRSSKIAEKYSASVLLMLKSNLKKSDTISACFSCLGLLIAWLENDIFFNNGNVSYGTCHVLRGIVSCLCLVVHYYIYRHYKILLEILKSQRIIYQQTNLHNSYLFKYYCFEILFNYIHCPPFFDFVIPNEQLGIQFDISFDAYISVIMLGRLYVFFRLFDHYSYWTGERAIRVCKINGFSPDSKFAIKAYLRYKPYYVLVICFFCSILVFGFAVRTFERPYTSPNRRFNFNYLWNSFWCIVVTMTTIGYGDIYPQTHLGRLVIIIACIWGIFILSLFVVALNNTIQLSKEESKAFEQLSHQDAIDKDLRDEAAKMIEKIMKLNLAKKKKIPIKKKILMRMDLIGMANRFKIRRKNANKVSKKNLDILGEMHDEVNREFADVIQCINPLKKTIPSISEAEELQGQINEKTLEVFENSKKLMTLLISLNTGQGKGYKTLEEVQPRFDFNGNEGVEKENTENNTTIPG